MYVFAVESVREAMTKDDVKSLVLIGFQASSTDSTFVQFFWNCRCVVIS